MSDLWALCVASFSLLSNVVLDVLACPGRCFAPLAWAFELEVPAISAVVAGHLVPNALVCGVGLLLLNSIDYIMNGSASRPPIVLLFISVCWMAFMLLLLADAAASVVVVVAAYCSLPSPLPLPPYPTPRTSVSIFLLSRWLPVPHNVHWRFWRPADKQQVWGKKYINQLGAWGVLLDVFVSRAGMIVVGARLSLQLSSDGWFLPAAACDTCVACWAVCMLSLASSQHDRVFLPEHAAMRKLFESTALSLGLLHASRRLPEQHWASLLFTAAAATIAAYGVLPQYVIDRTLPLLERFIIAAFRAISSSISFLAKLVWPQLAAAAALVWQRVLLLSPLLSILNRYITAPLWHVLSPLVVPAILAGVAVVHVAHAATVRFPRSRSVSASHPRTDAYWICA